MPETNNVPRTQTPSAEPNDPPVTFATVFEKEVGQITKAREARKVDTSKNGRDEVESSLVGLAFSGGGIRSATFNLGILQALAEKELLHKFDYLSTVSGGGYIGSWLAALTKRTARPGDFSPAEDALRKGRYEIGVPGEYSAIRWLRSYADYLTPQTGFFSADTGAMVGTWLRNVILNLIVIVLFLLSVILLPSVVVLFNWRVLLFHPTATFGAGISLVLLATIAMANSMMDFVRWEQFEKRSWWRRNSVELAVMFPFFVAAWLMNDGMWIWRDVAQNTLWFWLVGGAGLYTVSWLLAFLVFKIRKAITDREVGEPRESETPVSWPVLATAAAGAGALGGLFFYCYSRSLSRIRLNYDDIWLVVILGTVAVMLLMLFVAVLQLGLLGRGCVDLLREWWARAGGRLLLTVLTWVAVFAVVIFGPLALRLLLNSKLGQGLNVSAWLAWIASSVGGLFAGRSPRTNGERKTTIGADSFGLWSFVKSPRVLEVIAKVAPHVFVVGLLVLLSTGVHILAGWFFEPGLTSCVWNLAPKKFSDIYDMYWAIQSSPSEHWYWVLVAALTLAALALLLSWRIDVNDFSLHHFYRNRLVRCYLGASNQDRKPQPFTGFDPNDDIALSDFSEGYPGLYPIVNAALNVTRGGELGFQQRKAKSFIFTPLYCGYDLSSELGGSSGKGAYLPTRLGRLHKSQRKPGITLGTAMAISGAAASPNMGHYTSPATAFFMTLFDVRLGWWMGNPRDPQRWKSSGPLFGLAYLLSELLAQSGEAGRCVYLSDGGHFENLAIYELVKRRCRLIVACDSGADQAYGCGDLMGAIEKCRTDFGVDIKISIADIRPPSGQCLSPNSYTIGEIHYGPSAKDCGTLIYLKACLPADDVKAPLPARLAAGVRSYASAHTDFPHQSTADQWFDEVQFESYRALGEFIGSAAAEKIRKHIDDALK